jgi:hypothetical protein
VLPAQQPILASAISSTPKEAAYNEKDSVAEPGLPSLSAQRPHWQAGLDRWVTLNEMSFAMRYRSVFDLNNAHEFNQGQQRSITDGRLKLDEKGRYAIAFHASSGKYFNWSYSDFIGGGNKQALILEREKANASEQIKFGRAESLDAANYLASQSSGGWSFYVRQLYVDAEPVKGVELQYGGLGINRGVATEMTTYDNDGYIAGERISLKRPENFYFDEASVTYAYLGDLFTPNFFERGQRLAHADYHQFLLRKHFGKRVDSSFDYTWQNAAQTLHEDALVKLNGTHILDSFRLEIYQRLNGIYYPNVPHINTFYRTGGHGFGFTATKSVKHALLEGGIANIDEQSGVQTQVGVLGVTGLAVVGDQYGLGNRYFIRPTIHLTSYLDLTSYYTHLYGTQTDPTQLLWNKQALNFGLNWDIKKVLMKDGH